MTRSANGTGTAVVRASGKISVAGQAQFDAVEAFTVFWLPLIPYRAVHVVSVRQTKINRQDYQTLPLRWSFRVAAKAMLRAWSNGLIFVSVFMAGLFGLATYNMERDTQWMDYAFFTGLGVMFVVGILSKAIWYWMDKPELDFRTTLGPHRMGTADPINWKESSVREFVSHLLLGSGSQSLEEMVEKSIEQGKLTEALLYARLATRTNGARAVSRELLERALELKKRELIEQDG